MPSRKSKQRGEFLMARWILLALILGAMLAIPYWLKKNDDNKLKERAKAEADLNAGYKVVPETATSPSDNSARPISYGLTFAGANAQDQLSNVSYVSCHGQPPPTDKPHKDSCNPYAGDTSCRTVLPVMCIKAGEVAKLDAANGDPPQGWTAATLGATAPVMGALLGSRVVADARCEKELGAGWRMADFHAGGGWSFSGRPGQGMLSSGSTRYWLAIDDQPANCWDSKP